MGVPNRGDDADLEKPNNNRRCGQWHKDCSGCLDLAMKNYPIEDYSVAEAPLGVFSGRNSNTFVRCMFKKCLPYVANPFHTDNAAGWDQPCPSTSNF